MLREDSDGGPRGERLLVVGAGLVGSLLSIFLARRGYRVDVFERHPDPRRIDLSAQRSSINLSLCNRGFVALDRVGLGDAVRALTVPAYGRLIHGLDGSLTYQPYGTRGERTYSILRNDLNRILLDTAEKQYGVALHFQERCLEVDLATGAATFESARTGERNRFEATRVFGADGVFSTVRLRLQRTPCFDFSQQYLDHGYKELNVPATVQSHWLERREVVHLWPRGRSMLLGLPNLDGSFVCALHLPLAGEISFAAFAEAGQLMAFLRRSFPDVVELMPSAAEDFFRKPMNYLCCVRCFPWSHGDRVALIGDAAHAIVPFYAQGVNSGFEDCAVLDEALARHGGDWGAAFREYERCRKPDVDAVAELSMQHYRELADLAGNPRFQLRKRVERRLSELYPDSFVPLYSMVTFSSTPYAEALRRGREQETIIEKIMNAPGIESTGADFDRLIAQASGMPEELAGRIQA